MLPASSVIATSGRAREVRRDSRHSVLAESLDMDAQGRHELRKPQARAYRARRSSKRGDDVETSRRASSTNSYPFERSQRPTFLVDCFEVRVSCNLLAVIREVWVARRAPHIVTVRTGDGKCPYAAVRARLNLRTRTSCGQPQTVSTKEVSDDFTAKRCRVSGKRQGCMQAGHARHSLRTRRPRPLRGCGSPAHRSRSGARTRRQSHQRA